MYQAIAVLIFYIVCKCGRYFYTENLIGLSILAMLFCYAVWRDINKFLSIFIGYILLHSIYCLHSFPSFFEFAGQDFNNFFKNICGNGLAYFLIFMIVFLTLSEKIIDWLYDTLPFICIIDSVISIVNISFFNNPHGLVGASSIDGALIAVTLPTLHAYVRPRFKLRWQIIAILTAIISIFMLGGSVSVGCLTVAIIFMAWQGDKMQKYLMKLSPILIGISAAVYFAIGRNLFFTSGRYDIYTASFDYWKTHLNIWFGTGISTFWVYGPLIQREYKVQQGSWFTFMHSDILQIVFEFGLVGIVLFSIMIVNLYWEVLQNKKHELLAPISAYLVFMCFYYPVHSFVTAFVGAIIYIKAIRREHARS